MASIKYGDYESPGAMKKQGLSELMIGIPLSIIGIGLVFIAHGVVLIMYSEDHPMAKDERKNKLLDLYWDWNEDEILDGLEIGFVDKIKNSVGFTIYVLPIISILIGVLVFYTISYIPIIKQTALIVGFLAGFISYIYQFVQSSKNRRIDSELDQVAKYRGIYT